MEPGKGTVESERMRRGSPKGEPVARASESVPHPEGEGRGPDPATLARVIYGEGATINLGNFESQRIDVRLEIPARLGRIDEMYDFAKGWVEERLVAEVQAVTAAKGSGK